MKKLFLLGILPVLILSGSCTDNKEPAATSNEKTVISLDKVAGDRPYSPAIMSGNMLFVSGQVAIDPSTGVIQAESIEEQTRQALENIKSLVEKAGFSMKDVVKCNVLLKDISMYGPMNGVYKTYFPADPPARKAYAVKDLPLGALVEIDAVAIK